MSSKIVGKQITLTRGDTFRCVIEIYNSDGSVYTPIDGDEIRFSLKKNYRSQDVKINKIIPIDTLLLQINPEDTKTLRQPAEYVYDIQITHANGDVDTFIANGILKLTEEVD